MYRGTLLDDLIAAVEDAEASPGLDPQQEAKLAYGMPFEKNELTNLNRLNSDRSGVR